jgi:protein-tyrosine phosphatase
MAATLMKSMKRDEWLTVESRGLIVLFPEPYSAKAVTIMRNHGYKLENDTARQLEMEDFGEKTLILTMNREEKQKIINEYTGALNVYTVMEFAESSGDIMDPYGGETELYEMFYASILTWVDRVENKLHEINTKEDMK